MTSLTELRHPVNLEDLVPSEWLAVEVRQGAGRRGWSRPGKRENYVLYQAVPNAEVVTLISAQAGMQQIQTK